MSEEIEVYKSGEVTCPYCNYEYSDSWEFSMRNEGDSQEIECEECNKKFYVSFNIETSYTSKGLCDENKVKHNWEYFDHTKDEKRTYGRKCLTCNEYEFDIEKECVKSRENERCKECMVLHSPQNCPNKKGVKSREGVQ